MQLLRGPYALAVDAFSFFWSAWFLGRVDVEEPPGVPHDAGGLGAGARWIRHNAIIRAELLGVATLNLFNFMFFALFVLYATRYLHVKPAQLGIVLGVGVDRHGRRLLHRPDASRAGSGSGPRSSLGCFFFPAPLILVPAAGGPHWLVLTMPLRRRVHCPASG